MTPIASMLFAGFMWPGSTCVPRMEALRGMGLDVAVLDTTPVYGSRRRLVNSLSHRCYATPPVLRMNRALLDAVRGRAFDALWVEKGDWIWPSTLRALRAHVRYLVHYNTDDIFGRQSWFWLHRRGIPRYDAYLTTNRFNVLEIPERYGTRTIRAGMGYEQGYHDAPATSAPPGERPDVVFAGHWEPHTEAYVTALADAGLRVQVWGPHWRRAADPRWHGAEFLGREDYVRTIAAAKMALCSLSRRNRNESTGRSFEIPAIGIFLLAPFTKEHAFFFRDGKEAALFRTDAELVEKALHFSRHDYDRARIAAAGHHRCMELGLSWGDHMRREWPILKRIIEHGEMTVVPVDDEPCWPGYRAGVDCPPGAYSVASVNEQSTSIS